MKLIKNIILFFAILKFMNFKFQIKILNTINLNNNNF